jgi:excisionase family DNA binding protein
MNARITVAEIARHLNLGRQTVYSMLEGGILPGFRLGQRWLITRHAYEEWERSCGKSNVHSETGLFGDTEVRS